MCVTYEPLAGERIDDTCRTLVEMASQQKQAVTAVFNDVTIAAQPGDSADKLLQAWNEAVDRLAEEYRNSPKFRESEKRRKEFQRKADESAKAGIVDFDVSDASAWEKWRLTNEDDGYGEACLRYAARWARLMDQRIAGGAKLEAIADETSHEADTEGITGFMVCMATSMLISSWRHGERLKAWRELSKAVEA